MTSDRGVPNVVLICGTNSGVRAEPLPVEVEVAGVEVLPIKEIQIASGELSEIPVIFPVVTGVKPERRTKTSVQLVDGMMTPRETSELELSPGRICMIPELLPLVASKVAGEQVLPAVS
jgi:hypothetical protein